jgi:pyruvate,water dikinase
LSSAQDVAYLYPLDVIGGLSGKIPFKKLKEIVSARRLAFAYIRIGDKEYKIDGQPAIDLLGKIPFGNNSQKELRGKPAFTGIVKGQAVLVLGKADYSQISNADILITTSTLPDMVPYMKKVKAIVAEEGGVLSHASVISRELKIPAVIGVSGATQVIKSGDFVEVDAEQGIIRKI